MGAILNKIIGAGLKKGSEKLAKKNSLAKTTAELKRSITEYKRMLREKDYGPMSKASVESRLSSHQSYLKKATSGLGGNKPSMATKKNAPNPKAQEVATKRAKADAKVQRAKAKEGPKQKRLNEVGIGSKQDLQSRNPAAYDQLNQSAADASTAKRKALKAADKLKSNKKAPNKSSKMQNTDFISKGARKAQAKRKK